VVSIPAERADDLHRKRNFRGRKWGRAGTTGAEATRIGQELSQLSDAALLRRVKQGEENACHVLINRHADPLYRLALRLVGNEADAEDVLQKTLLGAFQRADAFQGRSSVKTWLTSILLNQAARHHRSAYRRQEREVTNLPEAHAAAEAGDGAAPRAEDMDIRMDVEAALECLSEQHREVIVLREFQGLSYEEIAGVLDVPRGTVESRLHRARRKLQQKLSDYMPE
jgi:RNA polymerase sigma-70 factor (ECF subfamily)